MWWTRLVFLVPLVSFIEVHASSSLRRLDENNGEAYSLRHGPCVRMKVADENDDDGNSYFYNGAYRAQYERYVSFYLCDSDDECDTMYVSDMDSYLEAMTGYIKNYCGSCANQCRRRLDEEEEEDGGGDYNDQVDCSTCKNECSPYLKNNGGTDETEYLNCQEGYDDGDLVYYSAPQCDSGRVNIGLFYDEDCSIKANREFDIGFSYATFETMEQIRVDCTNGACNDFYENAVNCMAEDGGDEDSKICKAAEKAGREPTYYKKPWYKKMHVKGILFAVLVIGCLFAFLSYTYFVRHKQPKIPLSELDHADVDRVPEIS